MLRTVFIGIISFIITLSAVAQPREGFDPGNDRGGLMIPENPDDLRVVSLELWLKFQLTGQRLYNFVREAAEFRAYLNVCKRHDLNVNMKPINAHAERNLQQIIIAHYEEPEYSVLEAMKKEDQARLMQDIASDLYAFEFGYRVATQRANIASSGKTNQTFCSAIADEYFKKYVALLATANKTLGNTE